MNRLLVIGLLLLLGACGSASPYSYDPPGESAAEHGGGPGPGNVPINPAVTTSGW